MNKSFFSRYALVIVCLVCFATPFVVRGARFSLQRMKNDVKDWLPADFQETREVEWFAEHFLGGRFVILSWPGCSADDPRYHLLLKKLQAETGDPPGAQEALEAAETARGNPDFQPTEQQLEDYEALQARRLGDRLGLFTDGEYFENWGGRQEKWLRGEGNSWYFLLPNGELYRWRPDSTLVGAAWRGVEHWAGRSRAEGELVATVGGNETPRPNRFHRDPRRLTARLCTGVITGPMLMDRLTAPDGPIWPRGSRLSDDDKRRVAEQEVTNRLSGLLFGESPPRLFDWTVPSLEAFLAPRRNLTLPADWRSQAHQFIGQLVRDKYGDNRQALLAASPSEQQQHWRELFAQLGVREPAPQTSFLVTLSEAGNRDMSRLVGRPLLGKPQGYLLNLAKDSGVNPADMGGQLHVGGPPVDNVAIDEEGSVTLLRLVGFSIALGIGLSYLSLRSMGVTMMVFASGGVAAVLSLAVVYWTGNTMDAVLMSMPSLIYVLGLSGAVHIVNYYRDAVEDHGLDGAPERALAHAWLPCSLAALTTALGLLSLYSSNILPIRKFGLFSAIGVLATLCLLFTFLPAALQMWPPRSRRRGSPADQGSRIASAVDRYWDAIGGWIAGRYLIILAVSLAIFLASGWGLFKVQTSVQLLKLFDRHAKIIRDYAWLEENLGNLVPMELVLRVPASHRMPDELSAADREDPRTPLKYNLLQRLELTDRVQKIVEREFGPTGRGYLGRGMSAATFAPSLPEPSAAGLTSGTSAERAAVNGRLAKRWYPEVMGAEFLQIDRSPKHRGDELWRVSLRVAALSDIDYGQFVHELRHAVEPILAAYRVRDQVLREIDERRRTDGRGHGFQKARLIMLGCPAPQPFEQRPENLDRTPDGFVAPAPQDPVDQSRIFAETLHDLLVSAGCTGRFAPRWIDPETTSLSDLFPTRDSLAEALSTQPDCVVLVGRHADYDVEFLRRHARGWVDATDHVFRFGEPPTFIQRLAGQAPAKPIEFSQTASDRDDPIQCVYTGVIPVVYKAQRTLLFSLVDSVGWAFIMIAAVMMILLRNGPWRWTRPLNVGAGLASMAPNVFPIVVVFGAMGHLGVLVDIGSMMTASVAMGVAVDDTIHFLTWFRDGMRQGLSRPESIRLAYRRCGSAMTQTTLIAGLGLSVFAASGFTPTQRFGSLMLALLFAVWLGDVLVLPAILASPLGRWFVPHPRTTPAPAADDSLDVVQPADEQPPFAADRQVAITLPHRDSVEAAEARRRNAS